MNDLYLNSFFFFNSKRLYVFKNWSQLFICLGLFISFLVSHKATAQISGIVNQYQPVTSISCNSVAVTDASPFSVGNRVLIIQMKGATISMANNNTFGTIQNYNDCGNYEFAEIIAINGNTITFQNQLLNSYTISGLVQLVLVPQYTNVTVNGQLTAQDWNGSTGGVLVIEVSGTLTINAPISVTGKGFRGSFGCNNPDGGCGNFPNYYYAVSSGDGAEKGEGIAIVDATMNGGRGALANGGGGGNKHNTGGGGGSNASMGGRGGDQAQFCGQQPIGGEGGMPLDYNTGRLFLGGGGGSSDHNNGVGTPGSDGGGIVIIRAQTIVSNNQSIESNGDNVGVVPNGIGDGAGGGGTGGTIVLDAATITGNLTLRTNGGNGGNQQTTYPSCFGPGGGGGTGPLLVSTPSLPPNITIQQLPGSAGIDVVSTSYCYLNSYGAEPGSPLSIVRYSIQLPESNSPAELLNIGPDISTCDASITIDPAINATSYLWSTGETTSTIQVSTTGSYWLSVVLPGSNCTVSDTINVVLGSLIIDAGPDQTICDGQTATLNVIVPNASNITWSNGVSNNIAFTPATTTTYTVTATEANGCSGTDQVTVAVIPPFTISVSPSITEGCAPLSITFTNTTSNSSNCDWLFSDGTSISGCGNQIVTFENSGCYDLTLTVTSNDGCQGIANFQSIVCLSEPPVASFTLSPTILNAENTTTTFSNNSVGGASYEWIFGDGSDNSALFAPQHSYPSNIPGSFLITLVTSAVNGCKDTANQLVYMEDNLIYYVPNAFTPDGDEFNQIFLPIFTSGFDPYDFNFQVFNRWGEIIFESNNHEIGWDGTYHGKLVQEGVYAWQIEFKTSKNDERKTINGHLNLLK
ncbi:MAG: gliding motility-associated C-terminal domain-containing protein [Fluviicola sp.]|nr:gliding motility-associated C-terminal domain-containing protein [Fluviicola sp.]